jgi:Fungal protein kinase
MPLVELQRYSEAYFEPPGGRGDRPARESFCKRSTPRIAIQKPNRGGREHAEKYVFTIFTIFIVRTLKNYAPIQIWCGRSLRGPNADAKMVLRKMVLSKWYWPEAFRALRHSDLVKERRLWLEPDLIAYQRAIVCRGTSCFRAGVSGAEEPRYVVKFSWTSDKRPPEADLLRLTRERGVKGVAKLFGHHRITSIATMREGLTFTNAHTFRTTTFSPPSSFSQSQPQSLLRQSFSQLHGLSIAEYSPRKRKSIDAGGRPSKRSRSNL